MSVKPLTSNHAAAIALKADECLPLFVILKEKSVFNWNWIHHFVIRALRIGETGKWKGYRRIGRWPNRNLHRVPCALDGPIERSETDQRATPGKDWGIESRSKESGVIGGLLVRCRRTLP